MTPPSWWPTYHHRLPLMLIAPCVQADDATFMVALGALTSLTQLRVTVAAASPASPPFVINLSTLSQLRSLQ
eukprot:scaffold108175_cov19-Tisochrysis_lutea.AAC.2